MDAFSKERLPGESPREHVARNYLIGALADDLLEYVREQYTDDEMFLEATHELYVDFIRYVASKLDLEPQK